MNVAEIATKLIKLLAEKYAQNGQTEFSVKSLVDAVEGADFSSVTAALQSLQGKGLVSLLGSGDNALVKLIPEALAGGEHADLIQKGMSLLGGLFK